MVFCRKTHPGRVIVVVVVDAPWFLSSPVSQRAVGGNTEANCGQFNSRDEGNKGSNGCGKGNGIGDDGRHCRGNGDGNGCSAFNVNGNGCGVGNAATTKSKKTTTATSIQHVNQHDNQHGGGRKKIRKRDKF